MSILEEQLLLSYRFAVVFLNSYVFDIRFQKVSGLTVSVKTEPLREGGENILTHHLPTYLEYEKLVLEKGRMAGGASILFNAQLSAMFSSLIFRPADIMVASLNENDIPVSAWLLNSAYPVKWSVSDFDASANSVVIDKLELAYRGMVNFDI